MKPQRINPFVNRQPLEPGRSAFFARIRKALARDDKGTFSPFDLAPGGEAGGGNEKLIRQVPREDPNRVERFIEKATGNSMKVVRVRADAMAPAIHAVLAAHGVKRTILNTGELGDQLAVAANLAEQNVQAVKWGTAGCAEAAFDCDASITDCRAAMADSGTLLVWSDKGFGRSSTLVAPVHIVLLPASRILADLVDALERLRREYPDVLPSNAVLINGPSKTADIEMNLITGVHGPKHLHVIVIDDL